MPSTPHRLAGAERRHQLIEAAMDLFSRKGFAGTTTREIALAAGVSEAIIFRHFRTKGDLYTAIIEHNLRSASALKTISGIEACMKRRDDEGLFRMLATAIVESHRKDARFERLMLHASLEGHELAAIYRQEFGLPIFASLRAYILRRQRSGALRRVDPAALILAIAGMANYYAMNVEPGEFAAKDDQMVEAFIAIAMNGARAPERKNSK